MVSPNGEENRGEKKDSPVNHPRTCSTLRLIMLNAPAALLSWTIPLFQ